MPAGKEIPLLNKEYVESNGIQGKELTGGLSFKAYMALHDIEDIKSRVDDSIESESGGESGGRSNSEISKRRAGLSRSSSVESLSSLLGDNSTQKADNGQKKGNLNKAKKLTSKIFNEAGNLADEKYGPDLMALQKEWKEMVERRQILKKLISKGEEADPETVERKKTAIDNMNKLLAEVDTGKGNIREAINKLYEERNKFVTDCVKDLNVKHMLNKMESVAKWQFFVELLYAQMQVGGNKTSGISQTIEDFVNKILKGIVEQKIYN
jgi:hypothetical protein